MNKAGYTITDSDLIKFYCGLGWMHLIVCVATLLEAIASMCYLRINQQEPNNALFVLLVTGLILVLITSSLIGILVFQLSRGKKLGHVALYGIMIFCQASMVFAKPSFIIIHSMNSNWALLAVQILMLLLIGATICYFWIQVSRLLALMKRQLANQPVNHRAQSAIIKNKKQDNEFDSSTRKIELNSIINESTTMIVAVGDTTKKTSSSLNNTA